MKNKWSRIIFFILILGILGFFGLGFLVLIVGESSLQALWILVSGWATYPHRIFPQVSYNIEMILCSLTALSLAMYFAHRLLCWLAGQVNALPNPWSFKFTAYLSFLLLSMFGTSIAMTGIIHQTAWLASSDQNTRRQGGFEAVMQRSAARALFMEMRIQVSKTRQEALPNSLSRFIAELENNELKISPMCPYRTGLPEPWLYPGSGRSLDDDVFPVLISPRPSEDNGILVLWSDSSIESFRALELPPEIAAFFE